MTDGGYFETIKRQNVQRESYPKFVQLYQIINLHHETIEVLPLPNFVLNCLQHVAVAHGGYFVNIVMEFLKD